MTLLEAISATIRRLHYSPRTEEAYLHWIRAYVAFHGGRHPRTLGAAEVTAFLNHLAVDRHTSASTQNQALCAVVFLYRRVLALDLPELVGLERAQRPHHLPAVLSRREVNALLEHLEPPFRLVAELLYGSGLRLLESLSIRVKDVDLDRHQIMVRRGKGEQDRAALLPTRVRPALEAQLERVARRHRAELALGRGPWTYLLPCAPRCRRPRRASPDSTSSRPPGRARTRRRAARSSTTMIYTHIVDRGPLGVVSLLDR
jgi:site-specific recombinase XerD